MKCLIILVCIFSFWFLCFLFQEPTIFIMLEKATCATFMCYFFWSLFYANGGEGKLAEFLRVVYSLAGTILWPVIFINLPSITPDMVWGLFVCSAVWVILCFYLVSKILSLR